MINKYTSLYPPLLFFLSPRNLLSFTLSTLKHFHSSIIIHTLYHWTLSLSFFTLSFVPHTRNHSQHSLPFSTLATILNTRKYTPDSQIFSRLVTISRLSTPSHKSLLTPFTRLLSRSLSHEASLTRLLSPSPIYHSCSCPLVFPFSQLSSQYFPNRLSLSLLYISPTLVLLSSYSLNSYLFILSLFLSLS
jgi:hypothetical protein